MGGTKDRLLTAAAELFAERGFHRTTVRDIAARARVNVAAGHYHYGSKRALYLAVLRAQFADVRATLQARGAAVPEGELRGLSRRQLAALLRTRVNVMLDLLIGPPPGLHGTLMHREMCDPSEALPVIVDEFILPMFGEMRAIAARLAPGVERKALERCVYSVVGQALFYRFTPRRARLSARARTRAGGAHHGVLAGGLRAGGGEQACAVGGRGAGYLRGESGARPSNALGGAASRVLPWFAPDFAPEAPRTPPRAPRRSRSPLPPMPAPVTRHPFLGFGDAPVAACGERERHPPAPSGVAQERPGAHGGCRGASGAKSGANQRRCVEPPPPKAFDARAPDSPRRYPGTRPTTAHACSSPPPAPCRPARTP